MYCVLHGYQTFGSVWSILRNSYGVGNHSLLSRVNFVIGKYHFFILPLDWSVEVHFLDIRVLFKNKNYIALN